MIDQPTKAPEQIDCDVHENNYPTKPASVFKVHGIDVCEQDIATLAPGMMVNDTVVTVLFE